MNSLSQGNAVSYPTLQLLVDGEWLGQTGRKSLPVHDPATGEWLADLPLATAADIDAAAEAAARAFPAWRATPAHERGRLLEAIAARIRERCESLATVLSREQGKTLREAMGELSVAADTFDWMAQEGRRAYGRLVPSRLAGVEQLVVQEPVGPVAAFSPWNFPAVLASRKIAAALAAGCTVVLKPAEETPGILVAIAAIAVECGLPRGVLNLLYGDPAQISQQLIESPAIAKLSFTGSVPVGRHLSTLAGMQMKKITLELGGHAPVVIDQDVDVELLAQAAIAAKYRNAGQLCHAPTRFIVHESVVASFTQALVTRAQALKLGHGLAADTQMGPLTHERRVQAMEAFCEDALARNAKIACGGERYGSRGFFFLPTVIADADTSLLAMREEPFGPLALVSRFTHLDDAIAQANHPDYGLGAYAFTGSYESARRLQEGIESGSLSINTFSITPPEMPFCGWKQSGMGAEMGSEGLHEYLKTKSVIRAPLPGRFA